MDILKTNSLPAVSLEEAFDIQTEKTPNIIEKEDDIKENRINTSTSPLQLRKVYNNGDTIPTTENKVEFEKEVQPFSLDITSTKEIQPLQETGTKGFKRKPFIEANTSEIQLSHLKQECIIPVFSKDNERTIAHQEFIEITQECYKQGISLP